MTMKAAEKIIDALTQLMEGYAELQDSVDHDYGSTDDDDGDDEEGQGELNDEADAAIVNELRAAVEAVIESEDYTAEEFASVLSALTDAVEEIDPDVFVSTAAAGDDEEDDEDEEDDDDDDLDADYTDVDGDLDLEDAPPPTKGKKR